MIVTTPPRERLLRIAQQMPASPQVLLQLGQLLLDVNSGLEEIARLLRRDTSLAARIIRISNSPAYGSGANIASIEDAVNRVGFAEVYRLTGFAAVAQITDRDLSFYGVTGPQLRDNTLVVALAIESLARLAGYDYRVAYTTGLMRATGKLVLDRYGKDAMQSGDRFSRSGLGGVLTWEQGFFGCTNVDVAATVLGGWQFPATIVEPVRQQYLTEPPKGANANMAVLLHIANDIANKAGFGLPGESNCWDISAERIQSVGVTEDFIRQSSEDAINAFSSIKGSL